jgi:hypothetical protein
MTELSEIVRERLKAAGPAGNHPDPDVLTAFAEQSLPARERTSVLEHVSRCTDCREVLALATPAQEAAAAQVAWSGPSRGWLRWPALRWGAAAACFVVVGAAVLLELNYKMDRYASLTPAAVRVSDEKQIAEEKGTAISDLAVQKAVTPSLAPSASTPYGATKEEKTVKRIPPPENSSDLPKRSMNTGLVRGLVTSREHAVAEANERGMSSNLERDRGDYQFSQQQTVQAQARAPVPPTAAPAPVPASPAGAEANSSDRSAAAYASGGTAGELMAKKQIPGKAKPSPMLDQATNGETAQAVGESKEVVEVTGLPVAAVPVNGRNVTPLVARWTISAEGQLQRSLDSGKTWEIVPVADSSSLSLVSAESTTNYQQAMRAPLSDKATARIEPSSEPNPPKFRALSANGNDVWVGGTAGLLYHSADAGMHWTRVKAVADGVTLAADIVTLDFADAQHGKLTTAAGKSWVTADAGNSWKKQ